MEAIVQEDIMGAGPFHRGVARGDVRFFFLPVHVKKVVLPIADPCQPVFSDFIEGENPNVKPMDDGMCSRLERCPDVLSVLQRHCPDPNSNCHEEPEYQTYGYCT